MPATAGSPGRVATLGMFILDAFEYDDLDSVPPGLPTSMQIGGGGTFAAVGARVWLPAENVQCIVDKGSDFPDSVLPSLEAFGPAMWRMRTDLSRLTTTGANIYRKSGRRDFEYRTPRVRLTFRDLLPDDLPRSTVDDAPTHVHLLCAPGRLVELLDELDELKRTAEGLRTWDPTLVYEPLPSRCRPADLEHLRRVGHRLHCVSPNHEEAAQFYDVADAGQAEPATVERLARQLLEVGCRTVIVRSGAEGAFVLGAGHQQGRWVPAYTRDQNDVVDVTGCGNSFLGGYTAGLARGYDDLHSALCGSVSAALVLMQFGLPAMTQGGRLWNGLDVEAARRRLVGIE